MVFSGSLRLSSVVCGLLIFYAHTLQADASVAVQLQNGGRHSCTFSHDEVIILDKHEYFICGPKNDPLLLSHVGYSWDAVQKTPSGELVIAEIRSVKNPTLVFENARAQTTSTPKPQSQEVKYSALQDVAHTLSPVSTLPYPQKRLTGTPDYEKLWSSWSTLVDSRLLEILHKFSESRNLIIELSDGKQIKCTRGKSSLPGGAACELFFCPEVRMGEKVYDGLLHHGSDPTARASVHLTLSRSGELGPAVSISRSYAETLELKIPLQERFKFDTEEDRELSRRKDQKNCKDERIEALFTQEEAAQEKITAALPTLDVVQVIDWMNGIFSSRLIPRALLGPQSCRQVDGKVLTEEAASHFKEFQNRYKVPELPTLKNAITSAKAEELFKTAAAMDDIPYKYIQDGCYARAHVIADRFEKQGVKTEKIWIFGELTPLKNSNIHWGFHVAPVVNVRTESGVIEKRVIDPSLATHALTVQEWEGMIKTPGKITESIYPAPSNTRVYLRTSVCFTASSVYAPDDNVSNRKYSRQSDAANLRDALETDRIYLKALDPDPLPGDPSPAADEEGRVNGKN
ncbi:MAG: hypothetical protein H7222_09165 [Methylotenera sp.]|nr:hypothetical protein [Oligoflexia bacterium]